MLDNTLTEENAIVLPCGYGNRKRVKEERERKRVSVSNCTRDEDYT